MDLVKVFNAELTSLYDLKPPISKVKMTALTKGAIRAIKFYKHVVQSVEKFLQKCRTEYKIPGLYVIDSIVRQSRHQFGVDRDVFAPRFAKNLPLTFYHIFKCLPEDKSKVIRVLNLWQKNEVFLPEVIQPIFDLADPDHPASRALQHQMAVKQQQEAVAAAAVNYQPATVGAPDDLGAGHVGSPPTSADLPRADLPANCHKDEADVVQYSSASGTAAASIDPLLIERLSHIQHLLKPSHEQQSLSTGAGNHGASSVSADVAAPAEQSEGERCAGGGAASAGLTGPSLESLGALLSNPGVIKQLQSLQQTLQSQRDQHQMDRARRLRQREDAFDRHLAQTVGSLPFASEIDFQPSCSTAGAVSSMIAVPPPPSSSSTCEPVSGVELGSCDLDMRHETGGACLLPVSVPTSTVPLPPATAATDAPSLSLDQRLMDSGGLVDMTVSGTADIDDRYRCRVPVDEEESRGDVPPPPPPPPPPPRRNSRSPSRRRRSRSRSYGGASSSSSRRSRRDRSRSRSRDRGRRTRSRSRDRGRRDREAERQHEKEREREREHERERKRRGLPPLRPQNLGVCSTTLWVGHLSKLVQQDDLSDLFGEYGDVLSIGVIPPRGCAFVCMNRRQDAARALAKLKNHKLQGKPITIAWAPGKGMKGKDFKDYWEAGLGCSYIPYNKLSRDCDLGLMEDGGMFDEDSLPDWMKVKYQELHSMDQLPLSGVPVSASGATTEPPPLAAPPDSLPPPLLSAFSPAAAARPLQTALLPTPTNVTPLLPAPLLVGGATASLAPASSMPLTAALDTPPPPLPPLPSAAVSQPSPLLTLPPPVLPPGGVTSQPPPVSAAGISLLAPPPVVAPVVMTTPMSQPPPSLTQPRASLLGAPPTSVPPPLPSLNGAPPSTTPIGLHNRTELDKRSSTSRWSDSADVAMTTVTSSAMKASTTDCDLRPIMTTPRKPDEGRLPQQSSASSGTNISLMQRLTSLAYGDGASVAVAAVSDHARRLSRHDDSRDTRSDTTPRHRRRMSRWGDEDGRRSRSRSRDDDESSSVRHSSVCVAAAAAGVSSSLQRALGLAPPSLPVAAEPVEHTASVDMMLESPPPPSTPPAPVVTLSKQPSPAIQQQPACVETQADMAGIVTCYDGSGDSHVVPLSHHQHMYEPQFERAGAQFHIQDANITNGAGVGVTEEQFVQFNHQRAPHFPVDFEEPTHQLGEIDHHPRSVDPSYVEPPYVESPYVEPPYVEAPVMMCGPRPPRPPPPCAASATGLRPMMMPRPRFPPAGPAYRPSLLPPRGMMRPMRPGGAPPHPLPHMPRGPRAMIRGGMWPDGGRGAGGPRPRPWPPGPMMGRGRPPRPFMRPAVDMHM